MNETVQNLVHAIRAGDALETENAFTLAMQEKLSAKLDDMRVAVAQGMFNQPEPVTEAMANGHEDAKHVAHQIAASHKNLAVTSDGDTHYVHHKDDEDGNESLQVHHEGGKIHLTHEQGTSGYHHETHDTPDSAIASGKKIANGA